MEGLSAYSSHHPLAIAGGLAALIGLVVYSVYFSPLRHIPGPKYAAAFRFPYIHHNLNGTLLPWLQKLHEQYGSMVRYSPNEISVISGSGEDNPWLDIYGFRTGKNKHTGSFEKDAAWYPKPVNKRPNVLGTSAADHGRQRRFLSHAFSDKALRDQEGLIQSYVDLLISRVREISEQKDPELRNGGSGWDARGTVDLCKWYNNFTFDVIGDLCFSEPFGSLADMRQHPWIPSMLESIKGLQFFYVMFYWPWSKLFGSLIINKKRIEERYKVNAWVKEKTLARIDMETQRPDFITAILQHQKTGLDDDESEEALELRNEEIVANASLFLIAGTETTATTLSMCSNLLLSYPSVLQKLQTMIRDRYTEDSEITIDAVSQMEYLTAVLHETLRCYPPVPAGFPRSVPNTGAEVCGVHIPGNCHASISVSQYVANRSSLNFVDPDTFVPERWLAPPPEKYKNDNLAIVQPFSFGPRNCMGKNLAYAELRLVMTKMLFYFDWKLDERSQNWTQKIVHNTLFSRPPLWVKLTPVSQA